MISWWINKRLRIIQKNNERKAAFINLSKAKRILITAYIDSADRQKEILNYINKLAEKHSIKAIFFFNKNKVESPSQSSEILFICKKDLNLFRLPKPIVMQQFTDFNEDLLIDLSTNNHTALQYIAAQSKATMKVSVQSSATSYFYDLYIQSKANAKYSEQIKNLHQYITTINKNEHANF
jgi:hypothetical protein